MKREFSTQVVAQDQYRIGPDGLIRVLAPRAEIRDNVIYHASHETGVIFGIEILLVKKDDKFKGPGAVESWQFHTIASIIEKWPKVLPSDWIQQLWTM